MATFLSADEKLSVEVTNEGGEFWALMDGACGVTDNGAFAKGGNRPPSLILAPYGKVDGILSLGVSATASEPAAGEIQPLTTCRKRFLELHAGSSEKALSDK